MRSERWFKARCAAAILAVCGGVACGFGPSRSSKVLDQLGRATTFAGADCDTPQKMVDIYTLEISRKAKEPLSVTLPAFAKRAATVCPKSHPTMKVSTNIDVAALRAIVGGKGTIADGPFPLEPWLRADIEQGKVVSVTLDLANVAR